jgi:hypothetical protein
MLPTAVGLLKLELRIPRGGKEYDGMAGAGGLHRVIG